MFKVLAILAVVFAVAAQAQIPPVGFEQVVAQHAARTSEAVNQIAAGSAAPPDVKAAVVAEAQKSIAVCVQQASAPGPFFQCTSQVIATVGSTLNPNVSSGASSVV
ncbi:uncharacterized protein LOC129740304 [Uranotaenia lowii]|uniref:uncharacterized protein LOC129740304 n=1 Tax=Uranotaenia lowii TaxID=190385 RepID=UPI002479E21B|nr:uncharacterized protein LOC129740304 [Uranotaenia lowii]